LTLAAPKSGATTPPNGANPPVSTNESPDSPAKNITAPENGLPSDAADSFYAANLTAAQILDYHTARAIDGLAHEIALNRIALQRARIEQPDNYALHMDLSNTIARLCRVQNAISRDRRQRGLDPSDRLMDEVITPGRLPITRDMI